MRKLISRLSLLVAALPLVIVAPVSAGANDFFTDFDSQPENLYFVNFESGVATPGLACGVDACASFENDGERSYMRVSVNPSTTPGDYVNTDITQLDLGQNTTNKGSYTATYGHPVILEARIKWSENYDLLGLSNKAEGTSGIVLWNPALDGPYGYPTGEYDHIGFVWASKDVMAGLITGFTGTTIVNQLPLGVARPLFPVNINDWMDVKMVWSENILGIQTVTYYVNNKLLGIHVLPVKLKGLALEIWNDNGEPTLCLEGLGSGGLPLCEENPSPAESQSFYIDYVKIIQP